MALTTREFLDQLRHDEENPTAPTGVCRFGCGKPCHGDQHEDCYYDAFGAEIDVHPLVGRRSFRCT